MDSSRTFIAVELGDAAIGSLLRLTQQLQNELTGVRWSRRDQMHVTLKFLGDVDNRQLPEVCEKLRLACAVVEPFGVTLKGIGTFPKHKPPRVVWAAVEEGRDSLQRLHQQLEDHLGEVGIPREGRAFTPHVTLGRVSRGADPQSLQNALAAVQSQHPIRFDVNQVVLLASVRERGSSIYEPLDRVELS